jgi:Mannosyltransferase (PIG-V)
VTADLQTKRVGWWHDRTVRSIVLVWLSWLVILVTYQAVVTDRFEIDRPDRVLAWTPGDTGRRDPELEPTLTDPFLNEHVAFDSEYYVSIAMNGYEDPLPGVVSPSSAGDEIPLNHAFFPLYPLAIRAVAAPLSLLGMTDVATATLAGVIVSALGALAAMLALHDLVRDELGRRAGLRAAFYLVAFPTGFFLAQVYAEGLFLGLSFWSLALMRKGRLLPAALLAVLAVWTRGVGVLLVIPLAWAWWRRTRHDPTRSERPAWTPILDGAWVLLPVGAYLAWRLSPWGEAFTIVEEEYFGRRLFWFDAAFESIGAAWDTIWTPTLSQTAFYYRLELAAVLIALVACVAVVRRYPDVAAYSLAMLVIPLTSGALQSMQRYVIAVPAIFVMLAVLGRSAAFDRGWTFVSVLWMGLLVTLYAFDFWVA